MAMQWTNRPANRPVPKMGPGNYKTYQILRPRETHFRRISCVEAECEKYERGWATTVMPGGPDEAVIRQLLQNGWWATETREEGGFLRFTFAPGQRCFLSVSKGHFSENGREPIFLVRRGDFREMEKTARELDATDWVDDFANHQDRLATEASKG